MPPAFSSFKPKSPPPPAKLSANKQATPPTTRHDEHHDPRWKFDTRGDPLNLQFGTPDSRAVSRYRLAGRGRVLGTTNAWHVLGNELSIGAPRATPRVGSSKFIAALEPPHSKIWPSSAKVTDTIDAEFLPLQQEDISEADDTEPAALVPDTLQTGDMLAIAQVEKILRSHPESFEHWLQLCELSTRHLPTSSLQRSRAKADVIVAILTRAIQTRPANAAVPQIAITRLKWGELIWTSDKVDREWQQALEASGSELMWLEWIGWRSRDYQSSDFSYSRAINDCVNCLNHISDERLKLACLWRTISIIQNAGYDELGTAIMQAQCELIFFAPDSVRRLEFEQQLNELQEFWESELPRLGEPGAIGWKNTSPSNSPSSESPDRPTSEQTMSLRANMDPYTAWMTEEIVMESHVPRRVMEESSDPYCTVMFEDIRRFLIPLRETSTRLLLKRVSLSILGLHIPGLHSVLHLVNAGLAQIQDYWDRSNLRRHAVMSQLLPVGKDKAGANGAATGDGLLAGPIAQGGEAFGPIKEWEYELCDPLTSAPGKGAYRMWESHDIQGVDVPFAREVLELLRDQEDPEWDRLSLAFEAAIDIPGALKRCRSYLEVNKGSAFLWDCHARLELLRGKELQALKVYEIACSTFSEGDSHNVRLWWSFAETEWLRGDNDRCLSVICRFATSGRSSSHSSVDILRVKSFLEGRVSDQSLEITRLNYLRLRALLELLTVSVESMFRLVDQFIERLDLTLKEFIACMALELLHHHTRTLKNAYPRSLVRQRVTSAVAQFPNNSLLLYFLLEAERGEGVWGRVRGMIGSGHGIREAKDQVSHNTAELSLARKAWELWALTNWLGRGDVEAESPTVRRFLAECADDPFLRQSGTFWRLYIEFEIRAKSLRRAKLLQQIALAECPLDKELHLLAFGPLRSVYTGAELRRILDAMNQREMRLRTDLVTDHGEGEGEGEDGLDEIERDADEYRRLLPYK